MRLLTNISLFVTFLFACAQGSAQISLASLVDTSQTKYIVPQGIPTYNSLKNLESDLFKNQRFHELGFFCKAEEKRWKETKVQFKMRLGTLSSSNKLEGYR